MSKVRSIKSSSSRKSSTPTILIPLTAEAMIAHRNQHIQETHVKDLFTNDGSTTIIYHKMISVKNSVSMREGNNLESVAQMMAENIVTSADNLDPLMSYEQWLDIDIATMTKIIQAMAEAATEEKKD